MVGGVAIDGASVAVNVTLTVAGCPLRAELTDRVTNAVTALDGVDHVDVSFGVMTDEQRHALRERLQAQSGEGQAEGQPQAPNIPFAEAGARTRVLGISSGKGGVGKSSVTVNVAIALARLGHEVGVLDADVYGFSVPRMLGIDQHPALMARKVHLGVAGVIENMSWFTGDDGKRYEIFGRGGGQQLADQLEVPLVGQVPLVTALREGGDEGRPIVATEPDSEAARAFSAVAERIATELAPKKIYRRELTIH